MTLLEDNLQSYEIRNTEETVKPQSKVDCTVGL